jgi:serine O-acetyltransferase
MIKTKDDLKFYLKEDLKRFGGKKPKLKDWVLKNEDWYIYLYIYHLRMIEYYSNTGNRKLKFFYHFFKYKRLGFNLRFTVHINTVGPGFRIYHTGDFLHVKRNCTIGKNCTLLPGVVIGNKNLKDDGSRVTIGDDCYLGLGAKVFGEVTIGNNAVVGANAVVVNDIPDNCVVGGIPARIIKKMD